MEDQHPWTSPPRARRSCRSSTGGGTPAGTPSWRSDPASRGRLELAGTRFNPQEDLARDALEEAIQSLRRRAYRAARVHLADAARRTYDPALEQRVALWRALADASRTASYADPAEKLPPEPFAALRDLLPRLDTLPDPERAFYAAETGRLAALHPDAAADPGLAALWTLSRAALASATDEPDAALLWCLRSARELAAFGGEGAQSAPGEYVRTLHQRAALRIGALTGETPTEDAAARKEAARANPHELLAALLEWADGRTGRDTRRRIADYAPLRYLEGAG